MNEPRISFGVRDHGPDARSLTPRFIVFGLAIIIAVTGLGLRLFQLQVAQAAFFQDQAPQQLTTTRPIPVARGLIYDRTGKVLVNNVPTFVLRILPAELPFDQRQAVADRLEKLTGRPARVIIERLDAHTGSQFELVRIADVKTETARVIAEDEDLFPGVKVAVEARRHYTQRRLMSHVLGWTGRISGPEFTRLRDRGYWPEDLLGKAGIESTFEDVLRGTYGLEEVELDRQGQEVRAPELLRAPEAGSSLELTINTKVQKDAEKALKWAMKRVGIKRGALIAMNPQNGEILAMVSLPTYDNNKFARGISTKEYNRLLNNPSRPLLNLAIGEQYPPGSTYKLVTGSGALQDGRIRPNTTIQTEKFIEIDRWKYWEWNKEGWGGLNIYDGFAHSSDTFFYQVAGKLGGIDRLAYWAHQYGFGRPTGIDLPGEVSGTVPTEAWKRRVLNEGYFTGELYQAGIGQGFNASTVMQVINAYAALANGGTLYKPQLVRKIIHPDGTVERVQPEVIRQLDIDKKVLRTMRVASRRVVTIGHTYNLVDLPIVVAGKSGTAEFGIRDKQNRLPFSNWFVGFVPKDERKTPSDPNGVAAVRREDSDLVVLAYLDDSRTKGNAATEVVKYFLQLHFNIKQDLRLHNLLVRDNFYQGNS